MDNLYTYPPSRLNDAARLAMVDAQIDNIRVLPECYVGASIEDIQQAIVGLKVMDLGALFSTLHLARACAAQANAINVLQAMLDGKLDAERKAMASLNA